MNDKDNRLIWIDLEMTGLNPDHDKILEIACIITDNQLNIIAQGPDIVINQPLECLERMDGWCTGVHKSSGLWDKVCASVVTLEQAEQIVLDFIKEHCAEKSAPLCGNSIWMDRFFLWRHMPKLYDYVHYRTIDISTIKELAKRWYQAGKEPFKKKNAHRALEDIEESIKELKFYRGHYFIK